MATSVKVMTRTAKFLQVIAFQSGGFRCPGLGAHKQVPFDDFVDLVRELGQVEVDVGLLVRKKSGPEFFSHEEVGIVESGKFREVCWDLEQRGSVGETWQETFGSLTVYSGTICDLLV